MASLATALCAGALIAASAAGRTPLAAVLCALQVALVLGWFVVAGLTSRWQLAGAAVAAGGVIAADATLLRAADPTQVRGLVGVLAAVVGLAFVVQLARRDGRERLTAGLAVTIGAAAVAIAGALLLGVRGGHSGVDVVAIALAAAGIAILPVQRPLPLWVTLPIGLAAGIVAGVLIGRANPVVGAGVGGVVALVAAVIALAARLGVSGITPVPAGPLKTLPVASVLPLVAIAPAVLVVARIMID